MKRPKKGGQVALGEDAADNKADEAQEGGGTGTCAGAGAGASRSGNPRREAPETRRMRTSSAPPLATQKVKINLMMTTTLPSVAASAMVASALQTSTSDAVQLWVCGARAEPTDSITS